MPIESASKMGYVNITWQGFYKTSCVKHNKSLETERIKNGFLRSDTAQADKKVKNTRENANNI